MEDCEKNKSAINTLQYFNYTGAVIIGGFLVYVLGRILSSGSISFYANVNLGQGKGTGASAGAYATMTFTRVSAIFSVALMILNGINLSSCSKEGWQWLKKVNLIFVGLYSVFAVFALYMLFKK